MLHSIIELCHNQLCIVKPVNFYESTSYNWLVTVVSYAGFFLLILKWKLNLCNSRRIRVINKSRNGALRVTCRFGSVANWKSDSFTGIYRSDATLHYNSINSGVAVNELPNISISYYIKLRGFQKCRRPNLYSVGPMPFNEIAPVHFYKLQSMTFTSLCVYFRTRSIYTVFKTVVSMCISITLLIIAFIRTVFIVLC